MSANVSDSGMYFDPGLSNIVTFEGTDQIIVRDSNGTVTTLYESTDNPEGVEGTEEIGPEIFDSFKDSMGRFRTQSLFIEYPHESYPAYFTLKKYDKDGAISLYRKYMEIADPTEYQVAIRCFGSWDHWQMLTSSKWFMDHLEGWRRELEIKMESDRYFEMRSQIEKAPDTPQAIQATKWLADRYGKKQVKRGRPTKEEKAGHLKRIAEDHADTKEDAQRIGL